MKSVERCLTKIISDSLIFAPSVANVGNGQAIGTNLYYALHLCTYIFNRLEFKSVNESCSPPFKHLLCWHPPTDHPKDVLHLHLTNEQTTSDSETAFNEEGGHMSDEEKEERFKRFISRKRREALVSRSKLGENPALIAEGTLLELK